MSVKVFVLGRPGSGKTTAVRRIIELAERRNYSVLRMKDYDILYNMFLEDTEGKFRPAEYGGFDVLDLSAFDTALKLLEKNVEAARRLPECEDLITIEFARDDYYKALSNFSPEFLKDSYFFFVDVNLETCIRRIYERMTIPPKPDYHFVSDYIMHTYYYKDNWDYMTYELKCTYGISKEVWAFDNCGSLSEYMAVVSDFAELIFRREFSKEEYPGDHRAKTYDAPDKVVDQLENDSPQTGSLPNEASRQESSFAEKPVTAMAVAMRQPERDMVSTPS